ncbi:hypothetical protein A2164_04590 [Candidatus Curtissbacteria bacterium RBG_13_35_7]|uniref:Hydrolase TatD n=1 Tax=Candidatus Curtissbacteria bacterium RBG_13_35_7 TaxID=1797705 RepID=A0A1F5G0D8_9BACT|nr:MAG: hypothetical protein A2164_04590 [Candidatus Curtissbacteria bacterium RBG_13_35_7]
MLVDAHAHLDQIDDLETVLTWAKEAGIGKIITVGSSIKSSKKAIEIATKYSTSGLQIYATCGIHPADGKDDTKRPDYIEQLKSACQSSDKVVGIGECGLDVRVTSVQLPETRDQERKFQKKLFVEQVKLAGELDLPLVIHCRNAWGEILDLVSGFRFQVSGVFHSFTGDWQAAKKALDLGFYISFSGIMTFKNASEIANVAKKMPIDKMLIETDSPYLSPDPMRGKKNEPKNVKIIAAVIANLRGQSVNEIESKTAENTRKLFKLL